MHRSRILALVAVLASGIVHANILDNHFRTDDFVRLFTLSNAGFADHVIRPHGGHLLLAYNAVFALLHAAFGLDAVHWFQLILLVHLLNVFLLFQVIERFTARPLLATFGAALWGMSPLNQGSLEWISVFGHAFVATCVLWILRDVAAVARQGAEVTRAMWVRWYGLLIVAASCFGVGLATALVFGPVLALLLPETSPNARAGWALASLLLVLPLAYAASYGLDARSTPHPTEPPWAGVPATPGALLGSAEFGLKLVAYGGAVLLTGPLLAIHPESVADGVAVGPLREVGLNGVVGASLALFALCLAALLWRWVGASRSERRALVGLALIPLAAYASIALARGSWASVSVDPSVVVTRYHYFGTLGLCVLLAVAAAGVARPGRPRPWLGAAGLALWGVAMLPLYFQASRSVASPVGDESWAAFQKAVDAMQQRIDAAPAGSQVTLNNWHFPIYDWRPVDRAVFPGWAAIFVITQPEDVVDGKRIFFEERDAQAFRKLTARPDTRVAGLLVAPP